MKYYILLLIWAFPCLVLGQLPPKPMESPKPFTILVLMNATPQWLSLSRTERSTYAETELMPLFARVAPDVEVRLFDSEYFHASVSDFMIVSTTDLNAYQLLIETLRDSKVYGVPYFEIRDIIMGQENRFEDFNAQLNPIQR